MKNLGLYKLSAVEELSSRSKIIVEDCIESCLLDNLLLYDTDTKKYYMCLDHYLNSWNSCYEVYYGTEDEVYEIWDKLKEEQEEL